MTTRYCPAWPHTVYHRPPTEYERAIAYPRFYCREYVFPDGWSCVVRDTWYSPQDRAIAVFEYKEVPREPEFSGGLPDAA